MSKEEEKVLKDLVTQCLATKGFLGKIQAEIRAGVFVALEEQDVLKDIFINKALKDFIETTNGALVISLVREFLEFFNLQFTNMVFDSETHAGIDYKFEGREKLATDLKLTYDQDEDENVPLLGLLVQSLNSSNNKKQFTANGLDNNYKVAVNKTTDDKLIESDEDCKLSNDIESVVQNYKEKLLEEEKIDMKIDISSLEKKLDTFKENNRLLNLSDLPPLNESVPQVDNLNNSNNFSSKVDMKHLNELLQFEPDGGETNYEEDFVSSGSEKKDKTDSMESEIDEELPSHSNHSNEDDLTADITISKESGQGDYTEKLSNS